MLRLGLIERATPVIKATISLGLGLAWTEVLCSSGVLLSTN